jgi:molybdopterin-guanine dinucleotide biosynthesis protein A
MELTDSEQLAVVSQPQGFILAGGGSSRMGRDKALLQLNGVAVVVRTARLVETVSRATTIVGAPERLGELGFTVIADDWPGAGPLGGIATALRATNASWNLIVACDLPYLTRAWLENIIARARASAADAVLPMNERGAEPLCAMYQKKCEPVIRAALERGIRKVTDGLARLRLESIAPAEWKAFDSDGLLFKNMNSPADYEEAKARLGGRAGQ